MKQFNGIHHISCIASSPKQTIQFYQHVLGLRLVKKSVNQDDVSSYHLFFSDYSGSLGTTITFFVYPNKPYRVDGSNCIDRIGLRVSTDEAVQFWKNRLEKLNINTGSLERRFDVLGFDFEDHDGIRLRIQSDEGLISKVGVFNHLEGIPNQHAILGLGQIDLRVQDRQAMHIWLVDHLKFTHHKTEQNTRLYYSKLDRNDTRFSVTTDLKKPEEAGYGSIHHVALQAINKDHLQEALDAFTILGYINSQIIDRYYFHSLYVREHNRILFEFATDSPGYTIDEPIETLGSILSLPPFLESFRNQIESQIEPL
jgi:glyoxalase family protein